MGGGGATSSSSSGPRPDGRVGDRDRDQADRAGPRPARRHPARLPGRGRRRRRPRSTPDAIDRAIEIIRKRTDKLGVAEPEISRLGATEIQVGLPNVQNAQQAIKQIGTTSQLYFYDFEGNVIPPPELERPEGSRPPPRTPNPSVYTFPNLYEAVKFASKRKPECFQNQCTTNGPTLLPVRQQVPPAAGRARREARRTCTSSSRTRSSRPGSTILSVPQGTVVVQAESQGPARSPRARARSRRHRSTCSRTARRSPATTSPTPSRTSTRRPTSPTSPSTSPTQGRRRSRT